MATNCCRAAQDRARLFLIWIGRSSGMLPPATFPSCGSRCSATRTEGRPADVHLGFEP
jgi:hypothetical protein